MRLSAACTGIVLAAVLAAFATPAGAQTSSTQVSDPVVVHQVTPPPTKKHSGTWMKAEFLHADNNSMVVSEQGNERMIHTFTYNDKVKAQMQKIIDAGGYQYGDKIKIKFTPGTTVALKIQGKPSKPL